MPRTPEPDQQGYPQGWEDWTVGKREKWYYDLDGKKILKGTDTPHTPYNQSDEIDKTARSQTGLNPLQERLRRDALADLSKPFKRSFPKDIPQGKIGS